MAVIASYEKGIGGRRPDARLVFVEHSTDDAALIGWTKPDGNPVTIEAASSSATRVPVIVVIGNDERSTP